MSGRSPRSVRIRRRATVGAGVGVLAAALAVLPATAAHAAAPKPTTVSVRIIGLNDLHGNLQPPSGSSGRVVLDDGSTVDAGGVAYLTTHVKQLRAEVKNSFVVSAGDNIGASPLTSAVFHDEPTIDALNAIGVTASAVGNHEFDEGYRELARIQLGGCNATDGCQFDQPYRGAKFPYLGANVTFDNGLPAVLPFTVTYSGGVPVGIIGVTLKNLPDVVLPSAIKGLRFGDEVQAINRTSQLLDRFGVRAQVVLMHQGDESEGGGPDSCNLSPTDDAAATIAKNATPEVDAFFAGHSHQQYNCTVKDPQGQPRPLIQGLAFGRLLSVVDLKINTRTRDVVRSATRADNVVVTRDVTPDAGVEAIVDRAVEKSAPLANRKVGTITGDILGRGASTPEEPLGDVIADGQLAATKGNGAQIAMTNPGGIRADLVYASSPAGEGDGVVTYGEAFTVQPFANIMQTITMTGAQLKAVLEEQSQPTTTRFLQISKGLSYTWTTAAAQGSHVSQLRLDGRAIEPGTSYRVSVNNFLAAGGDGFSTFTQGTNLTGGPVDLDAFTSYLTANSPVAPPAADRITVVG